MHSGSKVTLIANEDLISKNLSNNVLRSHFLYGITQDISGSITIQQHHHCFLQMCFFSMCTGIYVNTRVSNDATVGITSYLEGQNSTY